jgi:acetyl-CoA carboxylase carboxyltransferase component
MGNVKTKSRISRTAKPRSLRWAGEKLVAKHKEKGKLTARERLGMLFDAGHLPGDRYVCRAPLR